MEEQEKTAQLLEQLSCAVERKCPQCGELLSPIYNKDTGDMQLVALLAALKKEYKLGKDMFYLFSCSKCQHVEFVVANIEIL